MSLCCRSLSYAAGLFGSSTPTASRSLLRQSQTSFSTTTISSSSSSSSTESSEWTTSRASRSAYFLAGAVVAGAAAYGVSSLVTTKARAQELKQASLVKEEPAAGKLHQVVQSRGLLDTIGNTPLLELKKLNTNPLVKLYVKVEFVNPSGSIKDRIAKHIIETFEQKGLLKPGGVIIENSSGNTAAGVAMIAALKGYDAILVVPNKCSQEKVAALKAFGARVIVAPPGCSPTDPHHYENLAVTLAQKIPGAVRLDQYNNQLNVEAHYLTTGPEIWQQTQGNVDIFICGASTGGTISGVGRYLKEASGGRTQIYVADPSGSMILSRVHGSDQPLPGSTQIEGIGKEYKVACTHFDVIDNGLPVPDDAAFVTARRMAQEEGIMCGISSGANVWAALQLAEQATEPTTIVTILPDSGAKYFSKIFNSEFLVANRLISAEAAQEMDKVDTVETMSDLIAEFSSR